LQQPARKLCGARQREEIDLRDQPCALRGFQEIGRKQQRAVFASQT
jgi:hypothetical protein